MRSVAVAALAACAAAVPTSSTSSGAHVRAHIDFSSANGKLYANGVPFTIKGVNWYGGEGPGDLPEGLANEAGIFAHSIDHYMQLLADAGFNAIRIGFNHQAVLEAAPVLHFDATVEPSLQGKHYIEALLVIAQSAARHNILVALMCGRLTPHDAPGNGLWYSEVVPEEAVLLSWTHLARGLCAQWNVFAVDLVDEPHGTTWASPDSSVDWHAAAQRLGNHVLGVCPQWLVMVQGSRSVTWDSSTGATSPEMTAGENLMGVLQAPVELTDQSKLVYSPHVAPPSEHMIAAFDAANFPDNMAHVWNTRFGFVTAPHPKPHQALVVGRIGGLLADEKDTVWQQAMLAWVQNHMQGYQIGFFYDCLNPNPISGGLLHKDWNSLRTQKLDLLDEIVGTDVGSLPPSPPAGTRTRIPPDDAKTSSTTILSIFSENWGLELAEAQARIEDHHVTPTAKDDRIEIVFNTTLCFARPAARTHELCFEIVDLTSFEHVRFENRGCATLEASVEPQTVYLNDAATVQVYARFHALDERVFTLNTMTMVWLPAGVAVVLLSTCLAVLSRRKELAHRYPGAAEALMQKRSLCLQQLSTLAAALGMQEVALRLTRMTDEHAPLAGREGSSQMARELRQARNHCDDEGLSTPSSSNQGESASSARVAPGQPSLEQVCTQSGSLATASTGAAGTDLLSSIGDILSQSELLHKLPSDVGAPPASRPVMTAHAVRPIDSPPKMVISPRPVVLLSPPPDDNPGADSWSEIGATQQVQPQAQASTAAAYSDADDDADDARSMLSLGPLADAPVAMGATPGEQNGQAAAEAMPTADVPDAASGEQNRRAKSKQSRRYISMD